HIRRGLLFFFQAEDGIRDFHVTGVQTCALPISSHPLEFSDSLIDAYRDVPKLANYLHLPVQSGSDRVLAAMKRGYTALEFKQKRSEERRVGKERGARSGARIETESTVKP